MKIIVAGAGGYWAPNVIRNLKKFKEVEIYAVEPDESKWDRIPCDTIDKSVEECLKYEKIDAGIVVTPPSTHFQLAKILIENGCHVLVQKPVCQKVDEINKLTSVLSNRSDIVLMGCHTFMYHPAIQNIKKNIDSLGDVRYYKSTRINLGLFSRETNCLNDLLIHDLSILNYLFPNEKISFISATGSDQVKTGIVDTANITIKHASGFLANIDISWISAIKNRQILIVGDKKSVVFDDIKNENKVCYYDSGVDYDNNLLFSYRKGDMFSPKLDEVEAIYNELKEFFDCIKNKREPLSGKKQIEKLTKMLEVANLSVKNDGKPIYEIN